MSESEDLSSEGDGSPTISNRSRNSGEGSSGSSPKRKTPSPEKKLKPRYAVATIEQYTPATKDQLFLNKGDVLVGINQLYSTNLKIWEGENKRTRKRGIFHENNVQFFTGSPPTQPNVHMPGTPPSHRTQPQNCAEGTSQLNMTTVVVVVIAAIAAVVVVSVVGGESLFWKRFRNPVNLTELKGIFKAQDPVMWDTLRAGLLPSKTEAVKTFLFVHAKNGPTTECLIKKLSDNYCTVYRASEMYFDDGFVSEVKNSLQKRKCMVIYDLENLPADGITILKGFCDAYTPIVPKAEFYFALDTGEPPVSANVNKVARQKLETMWSKKYSYDEFGGTVTRLTQNVLRITGEDKLPC